jgi:hypothetical protein
MGKTNGTLFPNRSKISDLGGKGLGRKTQNQSFICKHCKKYVVELTNGSYRNHCPFCLYSVHVDNKPGDRAQTCRGLMKPIGVTFNSKKGFQVIH